jgi:7,8-dihydroneopterin aldolase/epimerase/oxygenase
MTDIVFVNGLVVHAHHGVGDDEMRIGQNFILDLELAMDLAAAGRSDKIADTASYDDIVKTATQAFSEHRYRLVEGAAGRVAAALLKTFPKVESVRVTVRKPHAPLVAHFEHVGVTIVRTRQDRHNA